MNDEQTIFELLKLSGVPPEKARQRAIWLKDDIEWIQFKKFLPLAEHSGLCDSHGRSIPIVEYIFGETAFSVNNAAKSSDKSSTSIGGSQLGRGNLLFFSIVSEIGRKHIPHLWLRDNDLKHYLQTSDKHLDALNEVWWLGRFPTATSVLARHKMHAGAEDIDWRFRLEGTNTWINLEVKNRPSDVARAAHGTRIGANKWLKGVAKKFIPSCEDELNLVGLTLFGEIDRHVQLEVSGWLQRQNVIDGVLIWAHEGRRKNNFDFQFKDKTHKVLGGCVIANPVEEQNMILRYEIVLDRKFWSKEMLDSLPPDL